MYSQYKIEHILDQLLPEKGFFLEIGAWDGIHFSHSKHLEEKGWQGVCVEPFPKNFEDRTCRLCKKPISGDGSPREFIKVSIDKRDGGDVSYLSGFSDRINLHMPLIKKYCEYKKIEVDTVAMETLYSLYNLPSHIDFLSVDVEGAELEVFESIDFSKCTFSVIVFEHNGIVEIQRGVGEILHSNGYLRHPVPELKWDDLYERVLNHDES